MSDQTAAPLMTQADAFAWMTSLVEWMKVNHVDTFRNREGIEVHLHPMAFVSHHRESPKAVVSAAPADETPEQLVARWRSSPVCLGCGHPRAMHGALGCRGENCKPELCAPPHVVEALHKLGAA